MRGLPHPQTLAIVAVEERVASADVDADLLVLPHLQALATVVVEEEVASADADADLLLPLQHLLLHPLLHPLVLAAVS
jgi:hypothetical protein